MALVRKTTLNVYQASVACVAGQPLTHEGCPATRYRGYITSHSQSNRSHTQALQTQDVGFSVPFTCNAQADKQTDTVTF